MAKFTFYVDFYPGLNPHQYGLSALTIPGMKSLTTKRIAFDVVIPDELIHDVDGHAAEVSRARLTDEDTEAE